MTYPAKVREDGGGSESVQASNSSLNLIPCEWNPEFATRRDLDYSTENKPYIETRAELGLEDESIVRAFMRSPDEPDVCLPQADKVEAFCFGASLESLREEKRKVGEPLVAWLDERSFEGGIGRPRTYRGPLTARDLYDELKKPRFSGSNHSIDTCQVNSGRSGATVTTGNSTTPDPDESRQEEPDAERRLIFITDLDRWSTYALIGTASYYQAFALRTALYRHLTFETFIGVEFSSEGLAMFQLAFHLPYYAWRSSQKPCEDHRQYANGGPLRHSQDVSFLNWKTCGSSGFLYEAQISCVVAGSDEWRWVAYCFVDTYFDAGEAKETVLSYHEDSLVNGGLRVDPFTYGVTDADNPTQNPRDYFLTAFRIRVNQVKREWQQVVEKVYQSIREYEQTHHYPLSLSSEHSSSKEAEDRDEKIRESLHWAIQVRGLSRKLSLALSKTVNACERFCDKHAVYFQNLSEPLPAIQMTLDELESLKETLESLAVRCDDFTRDLELHFNHEAVKVSNRQHELAQYNKGLSEIMMLLISPISLIAGIFSVIKNVIPFIPAKFGSFVYLNLTFGVLGIIHVVQLYRWPSRRGSLYGKVYCDSKTPAGWPSLSAPVVSAAAMIPAMASQPVSVKDDRTSSFRHPQPEGETNRAIEVTEATARCIEAKDIVVAIDSKPWETVMSSIGSQSRSSSVDMHVIADDRSNEAAVGSGAPIDALTGRTADELYRPAQKIPAAISTCEKSSVTDSIDAEELPREVISKDEISSHHMAPGHRYVVGQLSTTTGPISLDAGDRNDTQTTLSDQGYSDEEGFSQQEFPSDDDLSSDLSIMAYEKRRILDSVIDKFNNTFFSGASGSFHSQSERSKDSSSSNAANQPTSFDQGSQGYSSISAGKKRAQSQDPFSEDEDDSGRKREKKSKSAPSTTAPARLIACPFNKHDPKTYSASNKATRKFRACGGPGWETVARLKEHLYRVHYKPFQCARCWLTTKPAKELEEHARVPVPCSVQPQVVAWISHDKYDKLKDRKNKYHLSQSEEERWMRVYAVLFPEDLSPPSAYYEYHEQGSAGGAPHTSPSRNATFQQYSQENLPGRVREHFVALLDHRMVYVDESLKSAILDIVRACQAQLYKDWERSTSGVDQENEGDALTSSSERKEAASRAFHSGPSVSGPPTLNASLSASFVESASLPVGNMFSDPVRSGGNGKGSSSTTTDSGYDSLGWNLGFVNREAPPSPPRLFAPDSDNANLFLEDRRDAEAEGIVIPPAVSLDKSLTAPLDFDINDFFLDYGIS